MRRGRIHQLTTTPVTSGRRDRALIEARKPGADPAFTAAELERFGRYLLGLGDVPADEIPGTVRSAFDSWYLGPEDQP